MSIFRSAFSRCFLPALWCKTRRTLKNRSANRSAIRWISLDWVLVGTGLGAMQVVLDKGQRDDWFASPFITGFVVISVCALVTFVFWEWRQKQPIVHLRLFKNSSFAVANLLMLILRIGESARWCQIGPRRTSGAGVHCGESWRRFIARRILHFAADAHSGFPCLARGCALSDCLRASDYRVRLVSDDQFESGDRLPDGHGVASLSGGGSRVSVCSHQHHFLYGYATGGEQPGLRIDQPDTQHRRKHRDNRR
jgi:hypothetical protein